MSEITVSVWYSDVCFTKLNYIINSHVKIDNLLEKKEKEKKKMALFYSYLQNTLQKEKHRFKLNNYYTIKALWVTYLRKKLQIPSYFLQRSKEITPFSFIISTLPTFPLILTFSKITFVSKVTGNTGV